MHEKKKKKREKTKGREARRLPSIDKKNVENDVDFFVVHFTSALVSNIRNRFHPRKELSFLKFHFHTFSSRE